MDFSTGPLQALAPHMHNIVMHKGMRVNVVVMPDKDAKAVNMGGDSSMRGGCIAQKCYNPKTPTRDRLTSPLVRINGALQPVTWDFALDVAAEVSKHVIANHGANAYSVKTYSYQYVENTYTITKFVRLEHSTDFLHATPSGVAG